MKLSSSLSFLLSVRCYVNLRADCAAVIGLGREFIDFAHCVCTYTTLAYLRVRYVAFHARVLLCIQLHKVVVRTLSTWPIDVLEDLKEKEGPFEVI